MKDTKNKIYYFQEKSNDILDLQDEYTIEEIGIYFILKAGYFKYSGELTLENICQRCKFFGDKSKLNLMISKLFQIQNEFLINNNWLSEINGIKKLSEKRKEIAEIRWTKIKTKPKDNPDKPKKTQSVFIKPTLQEVNNYCLERNNKVDPESFLDYYEARGWKIKNVTVKDWRACVRTWERNSFTKSETKRFLTKQEIKDQADKDLFDKMLKKHEHGGFNDDEF